MGDELGMKKKEEQKEEREKDHVGRPNKNRRRADARGRLRFSADQTFTYKKPYWWTWLLHDVSMIAALSYTKDSNDELDMKQTEGTTERGKIKWSLKKIQ